MQPTTYTYYIPTSKVCELAHQLTTDECNNKKITIDKIDENGDTGYTDEAQDIFINYLNMIEDIMLDEEVKEDSITIDMTQSDCEDIINGESFK